MGLNSLSVSPASRTACTRVTTMPTTRLKIAKLDANDVSLIEQALVAIDGVHSARVDPNANEAVIEHDAAEVNETREALKRMGYISFPE